MVRASCAPSIAAHSLLPPEVSRIRRVRQSHPATRGRTSGIAKPLPLTIKARATAAGSGRRMDPADPGTDAHRGQRPATAAASLATGVCAEAWRVGRAVDRVAAALPWHPRAYLERWRPPGCCEGARSIARRILGIIDATPTSAHAWVTAGGTVVQGPANRTTHRARLV